MEVANGPYGARILLIFLRLVKVELQEDGIVIVDGGGAGPLRE